MCNDGGVTVGDGKSILFWTDPWIEGHCVANFMPELLQVVHSQHWSRWTVASALHNDAWIQDLVEPLTVPVLIQYLDIRRWMHLVQLIPNVPYLFEWRWCSSGLYSSHSAYTALFLREHAIMGAEEPQKTQALNK
jgi:hypothetical protein